MQGEVGRGLHLILRDQIKSYPSPTLPCFAWEGVRMKSEPATILARAFDIADATTAQLGMFGMSADVVAAMPAAHAFRGIADTG